MPKPPDLEGSEEESSSGVDGEGGGAVSLLTCAMWGSSKEKALGGWVLVGSASGCCGCVATLGKGRFCDTIDSCQRNGCGG